MTIKEHIMEILSDFPGLTDTELEKRLHKSHQTININCRQLVNQGVLERKSNPEKDGLIGNYPVTGIARPTLKVPSGNTTVTSKKPDESLDEEAVKTILNNWLKSNATCSLHLENAKWWASACRTGILYTNISERRMLYDTW